jgi:hypothetical protein
MAARECIPGHGPVELGGLPLHKHPELHQACFLGDFEKLVELLSVGVDGIDRKTAGGNTPLHWACKSGNMDLVQILIFFKANLHIKSDGGRTCMHTACAAGHHEVVQYLLKSGASVRDKATKAGGRGGETPLHIAAEAGDVEMCRILLDAGAEIDARTDEGWTPLHVATSDERAAVVRLLCKAGCATEAKDIYGKTAEMIARAMRNSELTEFIADANHDREVAVHATGTCSVPYCCCQRYRHGTRRRFCVCGHDPTTHYGPPRTELYRAHKEANNVWSAAKREAERRDLPDMSNSLMGRVRRAEIAAMYGKKTGVEVKVTQVEQALRDEFAAAWC